MEELAHIFDYRRLFASGRKWRGNNVRKVYRLGIGGANCGNSSHLHCGTRVGNWNGAQANTNSLAGPGRRFYWCWHLARPSAAFFFQRRTASCDWNVDPACLVFHLVGGITLFAQRKTRGLSISHRRPTDALRRIASLVRWRRDRRDATVSSEFDVNLIGRLICLFGNHWSRGWIHCLHLAIATL